jgi:transcription termination/antitermination protein NusA
MPSPIEQAIRQICEEKGLAYEAVLETIESALAAAYRKDFGEKNQNIEVEFDAETAQARAFDVKTVVEDVDLEELEAAEEARRAKAEERIAEIERLKEAGEEIPPELEEPLEDEGPTFNPKTEIMLTEANGIDKEIDLGQVLRQELEIPGEFGRMAAMTAKQVITQKLREAEREVLYSEFKEIESEVITGTVQRREGRIVLVDLGRTTGIIRPEDQIQFERYNSGDKLKFFVRQVNLTTKGPEILLSRTSEELVRIMFEIEIPEVADAAVEIKGISREAGSRSKVAVYTEDESIDPIGACIGQRGTRIQTIIAELGGEKIDIVEWSEDVEEFISNALSPAKVHGIELDEENKAATASVANDQLSLAIGKSGQNVRLAAQLVGWKINVAEEGGGEETEELKNEETEEQVEPVPEKLEGKEKLSTEEIAEAEEEEQQEEEKEEASEE